MERPLAVAVTGGIAAGKSEVLAAFARHGALVSSSDELVHRLASKRFLAVVGICVTLSASIAVGLYELLLRLEH